MGTRRHVTAGTDEHFQLVESAKLGCPTRQSAPREAPHFRCVVAPLRRCVRPPSGDQESRTPPPPVSTGIPWLGFVVYPTHRQVKGRKLRHSHRRLRARLAAYHAGAVSFAELDASIRGWIAHVGHADSWGLREKVLDSLVIRPAEHRRASAAPEP